MEPEFDGDFTASTGDIFGKRGKSKKNDKHLRKKDRLEGALADRGDQDVTNKRIKSEEVVAPSSSNTSSNPITSEVFRGINVAEYIEARALEVSNTMEALSEAARVEGKRVLQRLPRHMRRRAASYDARRIPRNQRKTALREVKDTPTKKVKMPSRKHRRRPKNLLEEYNRRKRNHAWLETHIWHAKRFKMVEKWGYKMAEEPCDKGLRSAYRSSSNGCLLQDVSFQGCIEISGPEIKILEVFEHLTSKHAGASIAAKNVLSGKRACTVLLYHYKTYPYQAVSLVDVLWKPDREDGEQGTKSRVLWMWCHPASHADVVETIKDGFLRLCNESKHNAEEAVYCDDPSLEELTQCRSSMDCKMDKGLEAVCKEDVSIMVKDELESSDCRRGAEQGENEVECNAVTAMNKVFEIKPKNYLQTFEISKNIQIKSMKLDFVKFRLTGPLSHQVLVSALQLHQIVDGTLGCWWNDFYSRESNTEVLEHSIDAWQLLCGVTNPGQLPPNVVLALTVLDPRMNIPIKKTWPGTNSGDCFPVSEDYQQKRKNLLTNWPKNLCQSPIWDGSTREEVKKGKISDAELNKKRSEMLDIGQRLEVAEDTSRIPILLIQRPGVRNPDSVSNHYGCGWDFIAPSGWGMPFLVSFVYQGAHVGGLREERNICLEAKVPCFPRDFPDTQSGQRCLDDERVNNEESYRRHPPAKRPNYEMLGVCHPFGAVWKTLVMEWKSCCRELLKTLGSSIAHDVNVSIHNGKHELESSCQKKCTNGVMFEESFYILRDRLLLQTMEDSLFCRIFSKPKRPSVVDFGPLGGNRASLLRHLLDSHQNALVAVSFQSIGRGHTSDNALISIPCQEDLEHLRADGKCIGPVEPLHKGPKSACLAVANSHGISKSLVKNIGLCTRWTIGQVTSGRYSLRTGNGAGIGLVTVPGLVACLEAQPSSTDHCIVLLRNISSQQYRFGRLNLVV